VKVELPSTVAFQVTAKFHPIQTAQEVSKVSEAIHPVTVNPSPTVAAPDTSNVAASISVAFKVVMFQVVAFKSQATDKSEAAVTSQLNVEALVTSRELRVASQTVSNVDVSISVASRATVVISVEVRLEIVPEVAAKFPASTVSAVTVVQVNVQSAVMFPVNVTSPLIVCRVTLDKSNPS